MRSKCGLYVSITPDGKIKRDLATISGKVSLESTTIETEIISFSELDFGPYAEIVDIIIVSANSLPVDGW